MTNECGSSELPRPKLITPLVTGEDGCVPLSLLMLAAGVLLGYVSEIVQSADESLQSLLLGISNQQ